MKNDKMISSSQCYCKPAIFVKTVIGIFHFCKSLKHHLDFCIRNNTKRRNITRKQSTTFALSGSHFGFWNRFGILGSTALKAFWHCRQCPSSTGLYFLKPSINRKTAQPYFNDKKAYLSITVCQISIEGFHI